MKVYYESNGQITMQGIRISYTVVFNSSGTEYAQSPHYHSSYELQYPMTDGWILTHDRSKTELAKRSVCFIPPFSFHHFLPSGSDGECKKISVKFLVGSPQQKESQMLKSINSALGKMNDIVILSEENISSLFNLLADFSREDYKRETLVSNIVSAIILSVVDCIEHNSIQGEGKNTRKITNAEHQYAILIEDFILSNYAEKSLTLSSLAEKICLSARQTERLCKKIFNASFTRLLMRQRMTIAQSLIFENTHSLSEIANMVGFNSYTGFYKCYKNFYGTSPKQS